MAGKGRKLKLVHPLLCWVTTFELNASERQLMIPMQMEKQICLSL
jgi:hypothetical protein